MSIFNWLLIGHLIGDWLMQNDWMAQGKKQGLLTWAGMAHFTIYTLVIMVAVYFATVMNKEPFFYFIFSLIVFGSHWLIDATGIVEAWMRFYGQSDFKLVRLVIDQLLHILVLALLTLDLS